MIKNLYKVSILLLAASLLLLTGCARQDRKIINNFNSRPFDQQQEKDGIKVGIKELKTKEANAIFNKTHISPTYKYKVLQIAIENNSQQNRILNRASFNIEVEPTKNIYKYFRMNAPAHSISPSFFTTIAMLPISFIISGIIVDIIGVGGPTPVSYALSRVLATIFLTPIVSLGVLVTSSIFFISRFHRHNKQTQKTINYLVLDLEKEIIIQPNQTLCKLVFIPKKEWTGKLEIKFFDQIQSLDFCF